MGRNEVATVFQPRLFVQMAYSYSQLLTKTREPSFEKYLFPEFSKKTSQTLSSRGGVFETFPLLRLQRLDYSIAHCRYLA